MRPGFGERPSSAAGLRERRRWSRKTSVAWPVRRSRWFGRHFSDGCESRHWLALAALWHELVAVQGAADRPRQRRRGRKSRSMRGRQLLIVAADSDSSYPVLLPEQGNDLAGIGVCASLCHARGAGPAGADSPVRPARQPRPWRALGPVPPFAAVGGTERGCTVTPARLSLAHHHDDAAGHRNTGGVGAVVSVCRSSHVRGALWDSAATWPPPGFRRHLAQGGPVREAIRAKNACRPIPDGGKLHRGRFNPP
jgi:hypothetical protein